MYLKVVLKGIFVITVLMLASGAYAEKVLWQYTYDCNEMPLATSAISRLGKTPVPWSAFSDTTAGAVSVSNGMLTINDMVVSGNHWMVADGALWGFPATVEVRFAIKQQYGTNNITPIRVGNGQTYFQWFATPTQIYGSKTVTIDMTQLRTVRITYDSSGANLYINTGTVIEKIGGSPFTDTGNSLAIGDLYSNQSGEFQFDYIYWLTGAAYDFNTQIYKANPSDCGWWGYYPADLDRDCKVDVADLAIMVEDWLICTDPAGAQCIVAID